MRSYSSNNFLHESNSKKISFDFDFKSEGMNHRKLQRNNIYIIKLYHKWNMYLIIESYKNSCILIVLNLIFYILQIITSFTYSKDETFWIKRFCFRFVFFRRIKEEILTSSMKKSRFVFFLGLSFLPLDHNQNELIIRSNEDFILSSFQSNKFELIFSVEISDCALSLENKLRD